MSHEQFEIERRIFRKDCISFFIGSTVNINYFNFAAMNAVVQAA